jgi:hypothetical protein
MRLKKISKASRPPADAPSATTGHVAGEIVVEAAGGRGEAARRRLLFRAGLRDFRFDDRAAMRRFAPPRGTPL